jgi:aminoglycoside phosphotransferase family enzyme/predicted kinase
LAAAFDDGQERFAIRSPLKERKGPFWLPTLLGEERMEPSSDSQEAVFAFLADPATHGGQAVKRIDTHAAVVFLAGDRALKVKRAVRFPFLDYSTLAKRHAACLAEMEVNRPFAPELYLRVLPIKRSKDGRLEIDGSGDTVEWAVEMRRFDENQTLDHLADAGRIDAALADQIARAVAHMHARAPVVDHEAWLAALQSFLDQNAEAFRERPDLFARAAADALERAAREAIVRLRPLLVERGRLGLVRRGHGDLHLRNIAMIDGRPVPFDAIEFDPMIAAGDVLYDLAFLLMDLVERGLKGPANAVLNRYLLETGRLDDLTGLAALPLFLSLRAAIRAKVAAAQMRHADKAAQAALAETAKVYFDLSVRLLAPPPPLLVAIGGLSGTGKSAVARALAPFLGPEPGAVIVRSDVERKRLFAVGELERLPSEAYHPDVSARVYARIADKAGRVVAARHAAVADAVYARPSERAAIAAVAARCSVEFRGLFLVADLDCRLRRIRARVGDASDADAAVARAQEQYSLNGIDWIKIDASGTLDDTLAKVRAAIAGGPAGKAKASGPA